LVIEAECFFKTIVIGTGCDDRFNGRFTLC
jgi:hypothetical protein